MGNNLKTEYNEELRRRIAAYYRKMYSWVGLKDIDARIEGRMDEDEKEFKRCSRLEDMLAMKMSDYENHLVVGAGTGGLIVALKHKGAKDVFGIEPYEEALLIAKEKAGIAGISLKNLTADVAEALPYADSSMDMIHCFTVLEHVSDVRKAIKEMYRVLKPGGLIYINTPDYRNIFEGHYKVYLPLVLGRRVNKFLLKIYKRPGSFFDSIQFVTEKSLDRILREEVDYYLRIYEKAPSDWAGRPGDSLKKSFYKRLVKFIYLRLSIPMNQEIVIKKREY